MTTTCWVCQRPGREVIEGKQYRCDPCDVTWDCRNLPVPPPPDSTLYPLGGCYQRIPHHDHATRSLPCP